VNASELYEIVCGVDQSAWPDQAWFDPDNASWANRKGFVTDGFAEAAFVGSMVAWLYKNRGGSFGMVEDPEGCWVGLPEAKPPYQTAYGTHYPTIIKALAAACKEAP
jgi:hypothetical protein